MKTRTLAMKRTFAIMLLCFMVIASAFAQAKKNAEPVEGQVKKACFHYYAGLIFGQIDEYLKGVKPPLIVIRDGNSATKDEKSLRAMIFPMGEKMRNSGLTDTDKATMLKNMLTTFDEADVQFIGADTAALTFLIKHDQKTSADTLCTLIVHRVDAATGVWKVIEEITDSKPVPLDYMKQLNQTG